MTPMLRPVADDDWPYSAAGWPERFTHYLPALVTLRQ
jgi:hypothetical protein